MALYAGIDLHSTNHVLAWTIRLETGPIERFAQVGHYASYRRCVDSRRVSNPGPALLGTYRAENRRRQSAAERRAP